MRRDFDMVVERDQDGYFAGSVPSCPGCYTQAKSLNLLVERMREAIGLCVEEMLLPPASLECVGVLRVSLSV